MEVAGIVKKYKLVELEKILDTTENNIEQAIYAKQIKVQENYVNILLETLGKSIVTFRECICLCANRFPDGALSLSRNIYEQFIHIAYIESKKDDAELIHKYYDDYMVKRAKALKFEAEKLCDSEKEQEEYTNQIAAILKKYGVKKYKDYWWSGKGDFAQMVEDVAEQNRELKGLIYRMHFCYKRACVAIHASCMGNQLRLGSKLEGIDLGPWDTGQESALFLATASMIYIIACVYEALEIDYHNQLKSMNEYLEYYMELLYE